MVDPRRLREMIALASFETGRGRTSLKISRYYRSDYVGVQLMKTFFLTTIADLLIAALIIAGNAEAIADALVYLDFVSAGVSIGVVYLTTLGISLLVTFAVSRLRCKRAAMDMSDYELHLKDLRDLG